MHKISQVRTDSNVYPCKVFLARPLDKMIQQKVPDHNTPNFAYQNLIPSKIWMVFSLLKCWIAIKQHFAFGMNFANMHGKRITKKG